MKTIVTKANKEYLQILKLAAKENESAVDDALRFLFDQDRSVTAEIIENHILSGQKTAPVTDIEISAVVLNAYDCLLGEVEVSA